MLSQYQQIKAQHKDCILFFRLGDFYEMFYDDAQKACGILDVVLTSRGAGKSGKVPMCGIPYHAADNYISRLIKAGLKVAICEQTEDPAQAKGLVKRDVIRVVSSGTYIDETSSEARYLLALSLNGRDIGLAFIDPASGTICANQYPDTAAAAKIIAKLPVCEVIYPEAEQDRVAELFSRPLLKNKNLALSSYSDWCFNPDIAQKSLCEHFQVHNLKGFGIDEQPQSVASCGALLEYLKAMNRMPMRHIDRISLYTDDDYVFVSAAAALGLELRQLVTALDKTLTPLGKRLFSYWVYHPLKNPAAILQRQSAVTELKNSEKTCRELEGLLRNTPDIEKSISRLSCGYCQARDFLALRNTLCRLPKIRAALEALAPKNTLFEIPDVPDIRGLLEKAINPEIPLSNPEGKIIQKGFHAELDSLRDIQENGRQWLKNFQAQEIKRTGINSLKLGYTGVFGYYIEITKANLNRAPQDYIRKQTLVNAERFITPQLKEFEEKMLSSDAQVLKIENQLLKEIQQKILQASLALHDFAGRLAALDALWSLSLIAALPGYIAPKINDTVEITIENGRHPVVEQDCRDPFVPNDLLLDCEQNHLLIITGPNMAGKSTYIRQAAVLVIMAQIGSYIPASRASIGVVDKIFTRIGAHDDISKGQSTFMVEMSETADILNNLTSHSLVVLDEIGRGTSTYDGLSLAWAVAEHLHSAKARALFATHFHELTALSENHPGVKNYNVAVKEWRDEIIFLHKIIPGSTDDSYGIYVAKLAGVPKEIIARAKQILSRLEISGNLQDKIRDNAPDEQQLALFTPDPAMQKIQNELAELDINKLTPLEALNKIQEWKNKS